jgi:hypothetical protein
MVLRYLGHQQWAARYGSVSYHNRENSERYGVIEFLLLLYNLLVGMYIHIYIILRDSQSAGTPLELQLPLNTMVNCQWHGNNVEDWVIRSQVSYFVIGKEIRKRFNE